MLSELAGSMGEHGGNARPDRLLLIEARDDGADVGARLRSTEFGCHPGACRRDPSHRQLRFMSPEQIVAMGVTNRYPGEEDRCYNWFGGA